MLLLVKLQETIYGYFLHFLNRTKSLNASQIYLDKMLEFLSRKRVVTANIIVTQIKGNIYSLSTSEIKLDDWFPEGQFKIQGYGLIYAK